VALTSALTRITTRDVLAILVTASALLFNGISLVTGRGPDAATMTLAGAVVGYYFKDTSVASLRQAFERTDAPLPDPDFGDGK
jgi:ABC-type sugar transport system permease subunit